MNGFEYAAAIHMIMDGLVDEGMTCVEAIHWRYDGERRNPWSEFECGNSSRRHTCRRCQRVNTTGMYKTRHQVELSGGLRKLHLMPCRV